MYCKCVGGHQLSMNWEVRVVAARGWWLRLRNGGNWKIWRELKDTAGNKIWRDGATAHPANKLNTTQHHIIKSQIPTISTMAAVADDNVKIIPFCAPLPSSSSLLTADHADESLTSSSNGGSVNSGFGIVGTITLRGRSAVVWFGWGEIESVGSEEERDFVVKDNNGVSSVGNGEILFLLVNILCAGHVIISHVMSISGKPPMGSLALSMPPVIRNGRPRLDGVSTTQLLGGSSEEDMILGHHISARLAKRIGCPIFVSCSLSGWGGDSGGSIAAGVGGGQGVASEMLSSPALSAGYDDTLQQHAAALAEREVSRIISREMQFLNATT